MDIRLSQDADFDVLAEELAGKFRDSAKFFKDARMALSFSGGGNLKNYRRQYRYQYPLYYKP